MTTLAKPHSQIALNASDYREIRIEAVRRIWAIVGTDEMSAHEGRLLTITDSSGRTIVEMPFAAAMGSGLAS